MQPPKPTEVFCIQNVEPEVLAYAMAKYSRSALSMRESIADISSQKASEFLNSFYFKYGHKSIADLAHIPMAVENISMLAAIETVDESRWDGQERSTRYQDFSKREYFTPDGLSSEGLTLYNGAIHALFDSYDSMSVSYLKVLRQQYPQPEGMDDGTYNRTLKARAFDVARYFLPLATNTSVGQVVSARTLEGQIVRMMTSPYPEVRHLAEAMRTAATEPSYQPETPDIPGPPSTPTLVKYTQPSAYLGELRAWAKLTVPAVMQDALPWPSDAVRMLPASMPPELELLATLLYEASHYPFIQIWDRLRKLPHSDIGGLLRELVGMRGPFDELARTWRVGSGFAFDIQMDIGGFRDLHRHRRCVQVFQDYAPVTPHYPAAYDIPQPLTGVLKSQYADAMYYAIDRIAKLRQELIATQGINGDNQKNADYTLPLGANRRFLMKMDLAELNYITELRTGPAGHFSYRNVAWDMFQQFRLRHPELAESFRVTDATLPFDIFKR